MINVLKYNGVMLDNNINDYATYDLLCCAQHNKDEEIYIILKGSGYYQVDDDCFPVAEGSVIRVAPQGRRGLCNTSDVPMIYICVQSKENSLEEHTTDDGERVAVEPKWRKNR